MLSMGDDNPLKSSRIVWGMGEGVVDAVLLLAGGLKALQTASIAAAFPISFVLLAMIWGLLKSLKEDSSAVKDTAVGFASDRTRIAQDLRA